MITTNYLDFLCSLANYLTNEIWNCDCNCYIIINKRFKKTLGSYIGDTDYPHIEISNQILDNIYITTDVLLHELTHWKLEQNNINNNDGSIEFEECLYNNGASSSGTIDINNYIPNKKIINYVDKFNERWYNSK